MSTHHTRLKTSKQVEQFNVDCFNWRGLLSLFNESLNENGMLFEHHFEHSSKWTNLVFQLLNSPSVKKKYWHCGQSTYCIWFCGDNFCCWVLPGKGVFHQQFLKTIFDFGSMWQLRIDASTGEKRTFFQHACKFQSCLLWISHVLASGPATQEQALEIRANDAASKVQQWKFAGFENTNFRARIYKYHCWTA